eukprot:scaffold52164_cov18-Tisochrysis_lutea.AAC.1
MPSPKARMQGEGMCSLSNGQRRSTQAACTEDCSGRMTWSALIRTGSEGLIKPELVSESHGRMQWMNDLACRDLVGLEGGLQHKNELGCTVLV